MRREECRRHRSTVQKHIIRPRSFGPAPAIGAARLRAASLPCNCVTRAEPDGAFENRTK